MNLKTKLAASLLMVGSVSMAQATVYDVSARFTDGGIQGETLFVGQLDFDMATNTVNGFTGMLSQSMWSWNDAQGKFVNMGGMGPAAGSSPAYDTVANYPGAMNGDAPWINLTYDSLVAPSLNGNLMTVTTFLQNTTDVVNGDAIGSGGYDITTPTWGSLKYGTTGGATPNQNGFFTLVFDVTDPTNTTALVDNIQYADCTAFGLTGPMITGSTCMTGFTDGMGTTGSMGGAPASLTIAAASPVPVPAAAWLFGGALMSLFGANRRKKVLPA